MDAFQLPRCGTSSDAANPAFECQGCGRRFEYGWNPMPCREPELLWGGVTALHLADSNRATATEYCPSGLSNVRDDLVKDGEWLKEMTT